MKTARGEHENGDQFFTTGVTDLMTSVAIIFVLLFVVALQPSPIASVSADPTDSTASGRGQQDLWYGIDQRLSRDKSRRVVFKIRLQAPALPRERSLAAPPVRPI